MNSKILKYSEAGLFYGGVLLNIWIICHFTFFGGVDGPSHLYYSRVVNNLISGNQFLSQYFVLNRLPVPNLTDHYLLALFDVFFRSSISEKILLIVFVAGFPLIFRFLIKRYNPEGIAASSFIIPFTHCTLLYMGAYNFCISFTFLFVAVYYYFKNFSDTSKSFSPLKYALFLLLVLLNYFTNGISFLFLMLICGLAELYWAYRQIKPKTINRKQIIKRWLLFSLLWIPGLIMLGIFNSALSNLHHASPIKFPLTQLLLWFYDFRCLSVYGNEEGIFTHILFFWLLIALSVAVYYRIKNTSARKFVLTDIFLLLFIGTVIAYFIIPQGAGVGLISDRMFYYFIIFLVLWIALQKNSGRIALMLSAVLMATHIIFFFSIHFPLLARLNTDALDVQQASAYINPNSVVSVFKIDDNSMESSISCILGVDKPLLILDWYEPDYGWFAVNRTIGKVPKLRIHYFPDYKIAWTDNTTNNVIAWVDYIFIYGDYNASKASGNSNIPIFEHRYTKIYSSPDNKVHILKLNQ